MKAEHRHDLKTNDLAKSLITFQDYVKVYGGRVFLGLAIVILVIVLLVQRSSRSRDEAVKVRDDLAYVIGQIDRLQGAQVYGEGRVSMRPAEADQVRRILQEIRDKSSDKKVLADAMIAQGDYAWALATYPDVPGAATQASLKPDKPPKECFNEAKEAYQQVITNYADQPSAIVRAHFGLAFVAEAEKDWDEAKRQYEAVKTTPDASPANIEYAGNRLKRLEEIRLPVLIGDVPEKEPVKPAASLPSLIDLVKPATTNTAPTTKTATEAPATKSTAPATKSTK